VETLTGLVLSAVFEVSNTLGTGFLEKVYERALMRELAIRQIRAEAQRPFEVRYKGDPIGVYQPDILVENELLIELKCVDRFSPEHIAQSLNYLKITNLKICLLINFQKPKVEWKRLINSAFLSEFI
jgi:GxxExxY protein